MIGTNVAGLRYMTKAMEESKGSFGDDDVAAPLVGAEGVLARVQGGGSKAKKSSGKKKRKLA